MTGAIDAAGRPIADAVSFGMLRITLAALVALSGCKKDTSVAPAVASAPTPISAGVIGADGVRRISIEAGLEGYKPERIGGKPGEKLLLVFTRTADSSCLAQLKAPDGKLVELPMGKPVEIAVTVPQGGELGFACGMDMFHGAIVASPG
jgi:Cupredoxin-like domain